MRIFKNGEFSTNEETICTVYNKVSKLYKEVK